MAAKHFGFTILLLLVSIVLFVPDLLGQNGKISRDDYILKYRDVAIKEMKLYGIPASITLAQGILESGHGNSELTQKANNHFGIKCHAGWKGGRYHMDDDAKDECFRVYDDASESFRDHSIFLKTRLRYQFLFDLELTDYKGWARGLKKAGYATNPRYPQLLIKLIEEHQLYQYDDPNIVISEQTLAENTKSKAKSNTSDKQYVPENTKAYELFGTGGNGREIYQNNGVKFVFARKNDNFLKIATEFNLYVYQIYKNNELDKKDQLKVGQIVYLERKKRKAAVDFHTVQAGESMHMISQKYGIRLKQLYKKNRMEEGTEPVPGEQLFLRKKRPR